MSSRRRKVVGISAALVTIIVVVSVIIIRSQKNEFEQIEAAIPGWLSETGCAKIEVIKPSPNTSFVKWTGHYASTATIDCEYVGGFLKYARFKSISALDVALHTRPHGARLCVFGRTLLGEELGNEAEDLRNFNVMCRNLHGRRYPG